MGNLLIRLLKKMDIENTNLDGVIVIKPQKFEDERGFFTELYTQRKYLSNNIPEESVQFNFSHSKQNVLRGLHFQMQKPQGKIVQVLNGTIFDVGVDIRRNSSTFGKYFSMELNHIDCFQVYFPPGIAHGFCVLTGSADVIYQCTDYYYPNDENGIIWNDPDLKIDWPIDNPIVSSKDQAFERLSRLKSDKYPKV
jgi:dTDP-4-dehydrorhamnose 3,5-epimerase